MSRAEALHKLLALGGMPRPEIQHVMGGDRSEIAAAVSSLVSMLTNPNPNHATPHEEPHMSENAPTSTPAMAFIAAQLAPANAPAAAEPDTLVEAADGFEDDDAEEAIGQRKSSRGARADGNALLRRTIGARFVIAREINGWDQSEAAVLLGYKNSTQLSLIERGVRLPPYAVLVAASSSYAVSIDFLVGIDDEVDLDSRSAARNALVRRLQGTLEKHARLVAGVLLDQSRFDPGAAIRATRLVSTVEALCQAVERFRARNPDFDEAPVGALMTRAAAEARACIEKVGALLDGADRRAELALQRAHEAIAAPADSSVGGA